jgi:nitrite reductase/ring-hydroxylating ferredoxin subunit
MNHPKDAKFELLKQEQAGDPGAFQKLMEQEKVPVPDHMASCNHITADDDLSIERYTSQEFFERELSKMWSKTWQFIGREDQIPNAGDHLLYEVGDMSVIVMRGSDGKIRGFHNSCLHRGRALRMTPGHVKELKCPYHGFTWSIDGALASIPCEWDFQHLNKATHDLPEVLVDQWAGFIFINPDEKAGPLLNYLGVMPDHFKDYQFEKAVTLAHVRRRVKGNWKVTQEAFMESMHEHVTHPQLLTFTAESDSQYDCYGDNISRSVTPMALPSPHTRGVIEGRTFYDTLVESGRMATADSDKYSLSEGQTARVSIAELNRQLFAEESGRDLSHVTVAELLDAILYSVFPNTQIWAGYGMNILYRIIPDGHDVDSCIYDVMVFGRNKNGEPPKASAEMTVLSVDQPFSAAPELGALGPVFDQDVRNLDAMAKGLRASKKGAVTLAHYQESRIRHLHETLDKYLNAAE